MNSDLLTGSIFRLFDRFVLVDLEKETYEYLNDTIPQFGHIPAVGNYNDLVDFIVSMVIGRDNQIFIQKNLQKDMIQKSFSMENSHVQYSYQIERECEQSEVLNIICTERKDGIATKVLLTRQNLTESKKKEREYQAKLEEALLAAKEANKAKSKFLSHMSHDIRTPLNAIIGMTEIAQKYVDDPQKETDILSKIKMSGEYLLMLVNDVLDMSQIEDDKIVLAKEEFLCSEPINHALPILRELAEKKQQKLEIRIEHPVDYYVIGDAHRLEQIILNVVGNAIKFTPVGGKIQVLIKEGPEITPGYVNYIFECKDNGPGMSRETIERIADPYFRADQCIESHIEGTGLGMTIVATIVRLMNGTMEIKSEPGKGATFRIRVTQQKVERKTVPEKLVAYRDEKKDYSGKKILLVEDNEMNVEVVLEMLKFIGVHADVAENGREAIKVLERSEENTYQMILMDIRMPVMDGYTATKSIRRSERKDLADIPIIALTANAFLEDVQMAAEAGFNEHLSKPIQIQDLNNCVRKWM